MNSYTLHNFATQHQNDLLAEAAKARRAREARAAARANGDEARHPLIWLRDAVGGFAFRLTSPKPAHRTSH